MELISSLDAPGFSSYLKKYGNTICGRHPIGKIWKWEKDKDFHLVFNKI